MIQTRFSSVLEIIWSMIICSDTIHQRLSLSVTLLPNLTFIPYSRGLKRALQPCDAFRLEKQISEMYTVPPVPFWRNIFRCGCHLHCSNKLSTTHGYPAFLLTPRSSAFEVICSHRVTVLQYLMICILLQIYYVISVEYTLSFQKMSYFSRI